MSCRVTENSVFNAIIYDFVLGFARLATIGSPEENRSSQSLWGINEREEMETRGLCTCSYQESQTSITVEKFIMHPKPDLENRLHGLTATWGHCVLTERLQQQNVINYKQQVKRHYKHIMNNRNFTNI